MAWLSDDTFRTVVANTPLVSIDLLVRQGGRFLVGLRENRPAQGEWFVPGGRIQKDESLADAFARVVRDELGLALPFASARFVAVNEHHYPDSIFGEAVSTHYLCLSYLVAMAETQELRADAQHAALAWRTPAQLQAESTVHPLTVKHLDDLAARGWLDDPTAS